MLRVNEIVELSVNRVLQKIPLWERTATLWGWWLFRKAFLYGTCIYVIDTILGRDRFRLGSSPLRWMKLSSWLPKPKTKQLDQESRALIESLGLETKDTLHKPGGYNRSKYKFYSEVEYPMSTKPLPDEEPLPRVEGEVYPPGFFGLMRTLSSLGDFSIDEVTRIWKTSQLRKLEPNDILFDYGDQDDSFHVVISGSICVSLIDDDFGHTHVKTVQPNEHIMSIFAILHFITKRGVPPKPVQAYAEEDSVVCQVPLSCLTAHFELRPTELIPFVKRGMAKIRQVYFEGFHQMAGLSKQFLKDSMLESNYKDFDFDPNNQSDVDEMVTSAREGIRRFLPLHDDDLNKCWVGMVGEGATVTRVGRTQKTLIYVHKGELMMVNRNKYRKLRKDFNGTKKVASYTNHHETVFYINPGCFVGSWRMLTGCPNYYTGMVPKGQKVVIVEVPLEIVKKIWIMHPGSVLILVNKLLRRFTDLCRRMDYCMQWTIAAPGRVIYRSGDPKIATFLVLHGRLRYRVFGNYMFVKRMEMEIRSKYGYYESGDWFGFVECVMAAPSMQKTVVADRYSQIVIVPPDLMTLIYQKYEHVTTSMTDYLSSRLHKDYTYEDVTPEIDKNASALITRPKYVLEKQPMLNILSVFPLTADIPGEFYCQEICRHYPRRTKFFTYQDFKSFIDQNMHEENITELVQWMIKHCGNEDDDQVQLIVLLGTANNVGLWNTVIARQADFIQVLGTFDCNAEMYKVEEMIAAEGWKAIRDFVFLHPSEVNKNPREDMSTRPKLNCVQPHGSGTWLIRRPWIDTHHHVRFPSCAFKFMDTLDPKFIIEFNEYKLIVGIDKYADLARLCRWLSNSMVGLVLGGGGAKGSAQIGILEYMLQLDIPIDYICGVSIGSFVGGLYAKFQDLETVNGHLRKLFVELSQPARYLSDITIPYTSMFRGRCVDEFVQNAFGDSRLEDLFIPYFCVTTDISGNHSRVHDFGPMWFYIRASMTLTMVFPPLVNPIDQHLLMDGGYSEILPGNHLRQNGVKYIFAIDIGDENGIPLFNIGYECSGLKCLLQSIMPFAPWPVVPTRMSFWEQLHFIAAKKYVGLVKKLDRRLVYIRPPIEFYSGKDFSKVEEMRLMAYYTTRRRFAGIRRGLPVDMMWSLLNLNDPDNHVSPHKLMKKEEDDPRNCNPPYSKLQEVL